MRACEGSGGPGDGAADGCELVDGLVLDLVGVQPGVVVGAWVAVGDLAVDHVPDRDERGVLDGDDGLEGAAAGDLQVGSATLFQIAANLLISRPEAHRQASRLLHFSARQPTEATLDRLWGTPFDLLILTTYGDHSLEPTIMEPVLLTFDAGLAAMFDFLRHASFQPLTPAAGPDTPIGSLVASRLDLPLGSPSSSHRSTSGDRNSGLQPSMARPADSGSKHGLTRSAPWSIGRNTCSLASPRPPRGCCPTVSRMIRAVQQPGTYREATGNPVDCQVALFEWEEAARPALLAVARRYHATVTYQDLAEDVQHRSGVRSDF